MSDELLDVELRRRLGCWVDELDPRALVRKVRRARERIMNALNLITKTVELASD